VKICLYEHSFESCSTCCKIQIGKAAGKAPWVLLLHLESFWDFTSSFCRASAFPHFGCHFIAVWNIKFQLGQTNQDSSCVRNLRPKGVLDFYQVSKGGGNYNLMVLSALHNLSSNFSSTVLFKCAAVTQTKTCFLSPKTCYHCKLLMKAILDFKWHVPKQWYIILALCLAICIVLRMSFRYVLTSLLTFIYWQNSCGS